MSKPKLAVYWASSCGGCDIAIVELGERLLELERMVDIIFWPCAMDFKYQDVEAMPDGYIDVTLFNGGIRTEEDSHIARLLRAKSQILVAFGSCATEGCIPGLGNIKGPDYALERAVCLAPSNDNPQGVLPQTYYAAPEGILTLPGLCPGLRSLGQVVPIDYRIPGCPPNYDQVWKAITAIVEGALPAPGGLLGVNPRAVCDECPRIREGKVRVSRFFRVHEIIPEPDRCLLEQGLVCAGPATHAGCGALCISANMPCRGCYGPPDGVEDQGAALLSAIVASMEGQSDAEINQALSTIVDPLGTFYRFSLASSYLQRLDGRGSAGVCSAQAEHDGSQEMGS